MELLDLPSELIPQYALNLDLSSINHLCTVNKEFNRAVCRNEHFWKMKFIRDYKFTPQYTGSWLKLYQEYNSLWGFGNGYSGQLGLGDGHGSNYPEEIPLKVKSASAGHSHTVVIDLEDNVWGFGRNEEGQLGIGEGNNVLIPIKIPDFLESTGPETLVYLKAKSISAGGFHTVMIDLDDRVRTFGSNNHGQLGRWNFSPTTIPNLRAKSIAAGRKHTAVIDSDDNVWVFGDNSYGQLGLGDGEDRSVPTRLSFKAKAISAGGAHTLMIDLDDNVWSTGLNRYGQLGLGIAIDQRLTPTLISGPESSSGARLSLKAKAISAGGSHTLMIDLDDNVWAFGSNIFGQLGLGDREHRFRPTKIPGLKAKSISAGNAHSTVIDLNDDLWVFGDNEEAQLGLEDEFDRTIPIKLSDFKVRSVSAGGEHTLAIAILIAGP